MTALLFPDETARLVPGERLVIVRAGDGCCSTLAPKDLFGVPRHDCTFVAPRAWVALTGPCSCPCHVELERLPADLCMEPDCRDGRRIVPLYTRHWCFNCDRANENDCHACDKLAGRGSIEVVPVVDGRYSSLLAGPMALLSTPTKVTLLANGMIICQVDIPPPVPGRDWGIVIDCVEAVS